METKLESVIAESMQVLDDAVDDLIRGDIQFRWKLNYDREQSDKMLARLNATGGVKTLKGQK